MSDYTQIIQEINTNLPDNTSQAITAAKLRTTLIDLTTTIQQNENEFESGLVVDSLTSTDATKALSANQGNVLDEKITDLNNNSIVKTGLVTPRSTTATNGRLQTDGTIYVSGTTWKYFIYDLDSTKNYTANLSIIKIETGRAYCGVQYYDSFNNYLGYEFTNAGTNNIYNTDVFLTPPAGAAYCYVQTVNYTGYNPSQLWTYDYTAAALEEVNDNIDLLTSNSLYFPDIPFTPVWNQGTINYNTGAVISGTSNSHTGWVYIGGITRILYSRVKMTSTTNNSGLAFYSSASVDGYISGQVGLRGVPSGGGTYEDTYIDVPSGATYLRTTIWGNSTYPYWPNFKLRDASETKYLDQNTIKDIAEEVAEEVVANKPPIDLTGKKISIIGDSISCFGTETQTRTQGYNAPYWIVKTVDVGNQIQAYVTWLDVYTSVNGTTPTNKSIGGVTLTSAMIGTLRTFTPVSEDVGKEIGVARWASAYTTKPWWQVVIDKTGATLCNNASWSGSRICEIPEGNDRHDAFVMSEAYSDYTVGRLRNRDDEGNFIIPDIILISRGANDLMGVDPEGGTQGESGVEDLTTPNLLTWDENNFNTHNFTEAYIHTILKLRRTYPDVYIVLCTLNVFKRSTTTKWPTNNGTYSIPDYNNKIREIANIMGCGLIEFDKDGITYENCYPDFISDSASAPIHPNTNGHRVMGEKAVSDIRYKFEPENN